MTDPLASVPLPLRETLPIHFVPIVVLVLLLAEREIIRARLGVNRAAAHRVVDLAILPLALLFLLFAGLRAHTMLG